jgi:hypothetical protein
MSTPMTPEEFKRALRGQLGSTNRGNVSDRMELDLQRNKSARLERARSRGARNAVPSSRALEPAPLGWDRVPTAGQRTMGPSVMGGNPISMGPVGSTGPTVTPASTQALDVLRTQLDPRQVINATGREMPAGGGLATQAPVPGAQGSLGSGPMRAQATYDRGAGATFGGTRPAAPYGQGPAAPRALGAAAGAIDDAAAAAMGGRQAAGGVDLGRYALSADDFVGAGGGGAGGFTRGFGNFKNNLKAGGGWGAALSRIGGGATAGFIGSGISRALWDDPESSGDDALAGALAWGGTGAGIGAALGSPLFGIGAAPGALIGGGIGAALGGIKGWFDGKDDSPTKAVEDFDGRLDELFTTYGVGANVENVIRQRVAAGTAFAETPEEIKQVYAAAIQDLPLLMEQAQMEDQANARYAAIQAAIMPLMEEQNALAKQSTQQAQGFLNQAASVQRDPQVADMLRAQSEQLMAQQMNYSNAAYGQMLTAPMMQQLFGVAPQSGPAGGIDQAALLQQLGV